MARRGFSLWRRKEGVAAVEFALIAPLMVLVLFGIVEVSELLGANRRVESVAASLSDVVARDTIVDQDDIDDLWRAIDHLMFPEASTGVSARITSVVIMSPTQARVGWSEGYGGMAGLAEGALFTLPTNMMTPDTSVIVTEVRYNYEPAIKVVLGSTIQMEHTEYRRPRVVDPIAFDDN